MAAEHSRFLGRSAAALVARPAPVDPVGYETVPARIMAGVLCRSAAALVALFHRDTAGFAIKPLPLLRSSAEGALVTLPALGPAVVAEIVTHLLGRSAAAFIGSHQGGPAVVA